MTDFIGIYENAFSKEYCERVIKYFDVMQEKGYTQNRMKAENMPKFLKDDDAFYAHTEEFLNLECTGNLHREFNEIFWKTYTEQYLATFEILKQSGKHNNFAFKVQKTVIGGGYHMWHYESDNRETCHRLLAWMVYLNDVEEGGETEFLYQHKRIKPKQGTLVIFPGSFTHTHRGNSPLSNTKYVITGWAEF
jgi:hypothetical protein